MVLDRRTIYHVLPLATFGLAVLLELGILSARNAALPLRMVLTLFAIGLVFATVFAALHHAETIAHRIGEPFGTLICLTVGGLRHRHQDLKRQGTNAYLAMLTALAVLTLVLPNHTLATDSAAQFGLIGLLCILLYGSFVYAQTGLHREDFVEELIEPESRQEIVGKKNIAANVLLLLVGLVGVVLLAEDIAAGMEDTLHAVNAVQTDAIVGAFIATMVLMPEAVSAIRASMANQLQRSLNIALGSACATIGLTVPAVTAVSLWTGKELTLGLGAGDTVLLLLAIGVSTLSFGTGRTTYLTGLVHLVIFVAYFFLIFFP